MFKKLLKNKIAQSTAEYALLIALVVAAVIAMQTYAQRAIQGRIRDAALYMKNETAALGNTAQYEAYYTDTTYNVDRESKDVTNLGKDKANYLKDESRGRFGNSTTTVNGITTGL